MGTYDLSKLGQTPLTVEDVPQYLREAIPALIEAINLQGDAQRTLNVAPDKPRVGDLRFADGSNWNPGSGAGLYRHDGTNWVLVMGAAGPGIYLPLAGGTMTGAITMGADTVMASSKLTGLSAGAANGNSVRYEQVIGQYLLLTGGTLSGALALGDNAITGVTDVDADTFTPTGTAPSPPVADRLYQDNICGGWCFWNMAGTQAIKDSHNVSSITDGGLGITTVTWDLDFTDVNYAVAGIADAVSNGSNWCLQVETTSSRAVGSCVVKGFPTGAGGGGLADLSNSGIIAFGGQ